jgi:hypothetical protein
MPDLINHALEVQEVGRPHRQTKMHISRQASSVLSS